MKIKYVCTQLRANSKTCKIKIRFKVDIKVYTI